MAASMISEVKKEISGLIPAPGKKVLKKVTSMVKRPYKDLQALYLRWSIPLLPGSAKFVAHRGLSGLAPENTVKAFKLAAQGGFASMECDIRRTKDHKLVIMHDESLMRMCGVDRPVSDLNYEELAAIPVTGGSHAYGKEADADPELRIPLLTDFLRICRDSSLVPMMELKDNWDIKEPLPDDYLMDIIRQTSEIMGDRPVIYVSFNIRSLLKMKKLHKDNAVNNATLFHLVKKIDTSRLRWYKKKGINLSFQGKNNTGAVINKAKKAGLELVVWTVDDPDKVRLYIKKKVDWIASNGRVWEKA